MYKRNLINSKVSPSKQTSCSGILSRKKRNKSNIESKSFEDSSFLKNIVFPYPSKNKQKNFEDNTKLSRNNSDKKTDERKFTSRNKRNDSIKKRKRVRIGPINNKSKAIITRRKSLRKNIEKSENEEESEIENEIKYIKIGEEEENKSKGKERGRKKDEENLRMIGKRRKREENKEKEEKNENSKDHSYYGKNNNEENKGETGSQEEEEEEEEYEYEEINTDLRLNKYPGMKKIPFRNLKKEKKYKDDDVYDYGNESNSENSSDNDSIYIQEEESKENEEDSLPSSLTGTDFLPCRKEEQEQIYNYIKNGLNTKGNYNSLYIAGMPGTGKTACVKTVLKILENEILNSRQKRSGKISGSYKNFTKLFLSGMEFPNLINFFKRIYQFIFSKKLKEGLININKYTHYLEEFFKNRYLYDPVRKNIQNNNSRNTSRNNSKNKKLDNSKNKNIISYNNIILNDPSNSHIILVIDEIDILISKSQNLLYNIFNWTTFEDSRLLIISISNTLDLPTRLIPKVKSRMGNNKIMFKPYTKEQIFQIIASKGINISYYTQDALKLSSMKVAAINGDLRRTFQILIKAKDLADEERREKENNKKGNKSNLIPYIDKSHIIQACNYLFNSSTKKTIEKLQIFEKIVLGCVLIKISDNHDNKIQIKDLYGKVSNFLKEYNNEIDDIKSNRSKKDNEKNYNLKITLFNLDLTWDSFKNTVYNLLRINILNKIESPNFNFCDFYVMIKFYIDEFMVVCESDKNFIIAWKILRKKIGGIEGDAEE